MKNNILLNKLLPLAWKFPLSRLFSSSSTITLLYHSVPEYGFDNNMNGDIFENHILFLKKNFEFIPIEELFSKRKKTDKIRVLLTFDDGFRNNAEVAAPILQRHRIPAVFFISNRHSEPKKYLWFNYLKYLELYFPKKGFYFNGDFMEMSPEKRQSTMNIIRNTLLDMKPQPFSMYKTIEGELPPLDDFLSPSEINNYCAGMTEEQVGELSNNPLFTVGIHTVDHPFLCRCDHNEIICQINNNRKWLESATGKKCNIIAYPIGDYDENILKICQDIDINIGFAVNPRLGKYHKMEYPRIGVYAASLNKLGVKVQWGNFLRNHHIKIG